MEYINNRALGDADTSLKFAMLISSRSFDALAMNETKVRSTMLKILETNFINAEIYRTQDKNRLYNSITMLGEYYHRVRLADNLPVHILGKSLLQLLQSELSDTKPVDVRLAKLVLSQITLNGRLLHTRHQPQLMQLFYHIRRQLIEQPALSATVKALLLMTLDMYYSNFEQINKWLEDMYTEYFLQGEKEADFLTQEEALTTEEANTLLTNGTHRLYERSSSENNTLENQTNDILPNTTKKWSEQVCEDTYENIFDDICNNVWNENSRSNDGFQSTIQSEQTDNKKEESYDPYKVTKSNNKQGNEQKLADTDKSQHLPRWRAPRFNNKETRIDKPRRNSNNQEGIEHNGHCEDNNSIRLYSINDRLKHSQEKNDRIMATSGGGHKNYYNASSIANSNWDRQSQHDDRSERSYVSNYERGHSQRGRQKNDGSRYFNNNNKQIFDKPPRFQKHHQKSGHIDSWRKNSNSPAFENYNENYENHGRRSTHAFTLPRQSKTIPDKVDNFIIPSLSYRRRSSQSPSGSNTELGKVGNFRPRQKNHQNNSNRYDSRSSLASEASSSVYMNRRYSRQFQSAERQLHGHNKPRRHNNNNNNNNNKNALNNEPHCKTTAVHDGNDVDDQIVKNARQTADYMNYLSQK